MALSNLKNYLTSTMRMSHVYQPVMIRRLFLNGGAADTQANAKMTLDKWGNCFK
jgi:hypothetical protein